MRRVVITGLGPITSVGIGKKAFLESLQSARSGIGPVSYFDSSIFDVHNAGEIKDWVPERYFPPNRLKRLDRYAQFAVGSAALALQDAGLHYSSDNPQTRAGVSFGTALGGVANAEIQHKAFVKGGPKSVHQTLALQVFGGSAHSNAAIEFGLRGVGTTNSNGCASGNVAIGEAMRYVRDGWADVMVAGAAEAPLSPLVFGSFAFIRTMSRNPEPSLACRPFDKGRDGFVMGEGAASLVLEEYEHAKSRDAHIYCEVAGYSLNNNAFHMIAPLPTGESCVQAMTNALASAKVRPESIDYINGHAISTQLNDANECFCVKQVFGEHARCLMISGTKAYYGHPLGASAAIEGIIYTLALQHGFVPPTLNHEEPDPACGLDVVPNQPREMRLNYILSNAFGFGGINSCVVYKRI
jgi:3-oxoacyl-[acyl-carrier-protein] synthase II